MNLCVKTENKNNYNQKMKLSVVLLFIISLSLSELKLRNMTTMQITREIGIGINLGNTLECFGDWIWEYGDHTPISYERSSLGKSKNP